MGWCEGRGVGTEFRSARERRQRRGAPLPIPGLLGPWPSPAHLTHRKGAPGALAETWPQPGRSLARAGQPRATRGAAAVL